MSKNCGFSPQFLCLKNDHGIPEREKAVPLSDSFRISCQNSFSSGERRDQHNERALGQVEVRDETVHELKRIAGIDKDVRPARPGLDVPDPVGR